MKELNYLVSSKDDVLQILKYAEAISAGKPGYKPKQKPVSKQRFKENIDKLMNRKK